MNKYMYGRHTENTGHSGRNRSLFLIIGLEADHQLLSPKTDAHFTVQRRVEG